MVPKLRKGTILKICIGIFIVSVQIARAYAEIADEGNNIQLNAPNDRRRGGRSGHNGGGGHGGRGHGGGRPGGGGHGGGGHGGRRPGGGGPGGGPGGGGQGGGGTGGGGQGGGGTGGGGTGGGGGSSTTCVAPAMCVFAPPGLVSQSCTLTDGSTGVSCPSFPHFPQSSRLPNLIQPDSTRMNEDAAESRTSARSQTIEEMLEKHESLSLRGFRKMKRSSRYRHDTLSSNNEHQSVAWRALKFFEMINSLPEERGRRHIRNPIEQELHRVVVSPVCPSSNGVSCGRPSKYRSADGSCNHPEIAHLGMVGQNVQRLMQNRYQDGTFAPRSLAKNGDPLPSPRAVSQSITNHQDVTDDRFTLSVMQWGQFVDHDLVLTPHFTLSDGSGISCCSAEGLFLPSSDLHPHCLPIDIPTDDPFYSAFGQQCMEFVRSLPGDACGLSYANQQNALTHYLDASNIYGSSLQEQTNLRTQSGGLLRSQSGDLLPAESEAFCFNTTHECFVAGDIRVNEQVDLSLIHTIWMREHNRVATTLASLHTTWSDEELFQEARRIVIAEYQHIIYNEWLPTLIEPRYIADNMLYMFPGESYSSSFFSSINPSVTNEFATAAFRFGHSMVSGLIKLFSSTSSASFGSVQLRDVFFDPHLLYSASTLDQMTRGLITQPSHKMDSAFTEDLTEHLFATGGDLYGLDLVSLNIQRGRDHGICTYADARKKLGDRVNSWSDLRDVMTDENIEMLKSVYSSVDDVDMFIGGILESPKSGVVLGSTFGKIVGDQFIRLRHADNYFYDLGGSRPSKFTPSQLSQLRRASWARVICDNVPAVGEVQPMAFRVADNEVNVLTACTSEAIPSVDLSAW